MPHEMRQRAGIELRNLDIPYRPPRFQRRATGRRPPPVPAGPPVTAATPAAGRQRPPPPSLPLPSPASRQPPAVSRRAAVPQRPGSAARSHEAFTGVFPPASISIIQIITKNISGSANRGQHRLGYRFNAAAPSITSINIQSPKKRGS